MSVTPYLFFDGRCQEALDFYTEALGAEIVMMLRFGENPEPPPGGVAAGLEDKIMHASMSINGQAIMASDGHATGKPEFKGFSLSLDLKDVAEADRIFSALSKDGRVEMPMAKTFFAKRFGMVADRFGVSWMLIVQ